MSNTGVKACWRLVGGRQVSHLSPETKSLNFVNEIPL